MSLNTSSPASCRQHFRYPPAAPRQIGVLRCVLILSTLFVIGFCCTMLLMHYFLKGSNVVPCKSCSGKKIPERGYHGLRLCRDMPWNPYQPKPTCKDRRIVSERCHEICTTKACMKTAADMINRMDITIDPCNDFHSFSCGNYDKISMGQVRREQFMSDVAEEIIPVISGIIEDIPKHLPEDVPGHSASKARNLYDSCVSFRSTEEMAIPAIHKYLDYFGIKNWPYLNNDYYFFYPDFQEALTRIGLYEAPVFFSYEIPENSHNSFGKNTTEGGTPDYPLNIKVRSTRRGLFQVPYSVEHDDVSFLISDILDYFDISDESTNETMADIFYFDDALDDIQKSSRKRIKKCTLNSSISCSSYQFHCGKEKDPEMEWWCTIAINVLNITGMREKHPSFNVILQDKIYFKAITDLIESTGHRTIAHGLAFHVFLKNLLVMSYRFRRISGVTDMLKALISKFEDQRKFLCASWTIIHLPALLGGVFYSKIYSGELRKETDDIYTDVQKYLVQHIRNMTWMDKDAQESLEALLWRVRMSLDDYIPYISDPSELDAFYERLQITDEDFFSNMMESRKFRYASQLLYHDNRTTMLIMERPKFQFLPNYMEEVIDMDFSSFIYPLISKDRPRYSNLGFFGSFLAHEFSHAVEVFLRDRENMSSSFENSLREKKKCLIDQYSEYEIDLIETKIDGNFTLHENMADFFSLRPTYQALKSYQKAHGAQKALPGLPFNEEQLFFISYAQWWCENNTPETIKRYLKDNHSPGKYRVLGMMRNFEPFSAAFNCPLGSPMNPVEKCDF